ncbi:MULTISPECIES: hypothetical protein [unclassified Bradyrhizobium]|uniref:hypothetical protein n=1 Tax=unclassified Bradyrhizobium TaxID=2631580 RepID=UPI0029167811|nr:MULTISPECIES: hypothetical protein [unclassified Bradyrhizobium]
MTLKKPLSEVAFLNPLRSFLLALAVTSLGSVVSARAQQKIPALLEVPSAIATTEPSLVTQRTALVQERNDLRGKFASQKAQCSAVDERDTAKVASCTKTAQNLSDALERHIKISEAFNQTVSNIIAPCKALADQLALDTIAFERHSKNIGRVLRELDKWTADNQDAQKDALKVATSALTGGVGEKLISKANSARSFKGWLTRYRNQLAKSNVALEALQDKIEHSARGYVNASILVIGGQATMAAKTLEDARNLIKMEIEVVASVEGESDASIREILNDERIISLLESDNASVDFRLMLTASAFSSREVEKYMGKIAGPVANLVEFLADYGYDAYKWNESRKLILQQNEILEKDLQIVDVLKKQQMCTVQKLNDCKAGNIIRACSSKN